MYHLQAVTRIAFVMNQRGWYCLVPGWPQITGITVVTRRGMRLNVNLRHPGITLTLRRAHGTIEITPCHGVDRFVPEETLLTIALSVVTDQFKVLKKGNVTGNVYRLMAEEAVPLYDSPTRGANVMRRLRPGSLLVGFGDPGEMRQINTADQFFGYIKRSVKLVPVQGLDPRGSVRPRKTRCRRVRTAAPGRNGFGLCNPAKPHKA